MEYFELQKPEHHTSTLIPERQARNRGCARQDEILLSQISYLRQ